VWPSGDSAATRSATTSTSHIVATVGPLPDSQAAQAPAPSAVRIAWAEAGTLASRGS